MAWACVRGAAGRGNAKVLLQLSSAVVQQHGEALEHASVELRGDRGVVMAAVQQDGGALE